MFLRYDTSLKLFLGLVWASYFRRVLSLMEWKAHFKESIIHISLFTRSKPIFKVMYCHIITLAKPQSQMLNIFF